MWRKPLLLLHKFKRLPHYMTQILVTLHGRVGQEHHAAALRSLHCINIKGAAAAPSGGIRRRQEALADPEPSIAQQGREGWIKGPLTAAQRRSWRDRLGGSWKWSEALPGAQLLNVRF